MEERPVFASASASGGSLEAAVRRVVASVRDQLAGARPDVAFVFVSPEYGGGIATLGRRVRARLGARHLLGCTAGGVLERAGEIETGPALSVLAGTLPGARMQPFELRHDQLLTMPDPDVLRAAVGFPESARPFFVVLADPFTLDADLLLTRLDEAYEGSTATGGLASGGTRPGRHLLYMDGAVSLFGAVGLAISGVRVRSAVSQGCRPIGRRFVITRAASNKVLTLSGRPALQVLQETVSGLPDADRELAQRNLLIGRVAHEAQDDFGRGDFVVRNLLGVVPEEEAVIVADKVRVGQTVQLQLRDGGSASRDFADVLSAARAEAQPAAALVFSCAGRGSGLFGEGDHDVRAVGRHLGDVPLAGFFCNGEIGQVGGRNFLHGFTASLALF